MSPIRISIEEMLDDRTIKEIGADHEDLAVCVTRICGLVRRQEEEIVALRKKLGRAHPQIPELAGMIPVVVYFGNRADADEFIHVARLAKPGLTAKALPPL